MLLSLSFFASKDFTELLDVLHPTILLTLQFCIRQATSLKHSYAQYTELAADLEPTVVSIRGVNYDHRI